jgi:transcription elongation GreA/GreB family factor
MPQALPHAWLRWHLRHSILEADRAAARDALARAESDDARAECERKLAEIERHLRNLGPDPSAKMG